MPLTPRFLVFLARNPATGTDRRLVGSGFSPWCGSTVWLAALPPYAIIGLFPVDSQGIPSPRGAVQCVRNAISLLKKGTGSERTSENAANTVVVRCLSPFSTGCYANSIHRGLSFAGLFTHEPTLRAVINSLG